MSDLPIEYMGHMSRDTRTSAVHPLTEQALDTRKVRAKETALLLAKRILEYTEWRLNESPGSSPRLVSGEDVDSLEYAMGQAPVLNDSERQYIGYARERWTQLIQLTTQAPTLKISSGGNPHD